MTADDELLRQVGVYLDECEGATVLPERVLDAVRADLPLTPQSQPGWLARFFEMNTSYRIAIAGGILAIAAIIGLNLLGEARIGPSPDDPTASASPAASATEDRADIPSELQHLFIGPPKGVPELGPADRGDVSFAGSVFRYELGSRAALISTADLYGDGFFRLESPGDAFCAEGDVGIYVYYLSPRGSFLSIMPGEDDCAVRAAAIPGDYLRSSCRTINNGCLGILEAGSYTSHSFNPYTADRVSRHGGLSYDVGDGWAAYVDLPAIYGLTSQEHYEGYPIGNECYECEGDRDVISFFRSPMAADEDCRDAPATGVGSSAQELVDWLTGHDGLLTEPTAQSTINGIPTITLTVEAAGDWTGTCDPENPTVAVPLFIGQESDFHWALTPGDRNQITLFDLGGGMTVAAVVDTADPADLDAFAAEAATIIESVELSAE